MRNIFPINIDRDIRLDELIPEEKDELVTDSRPLLRALKIDPARTDYLRKAVQDYIEECVYYFHGIALNRGFSLEQISRLHFNDITSLPNLTPNGLLLAKKEVLSSYNTVMKAATEIVKYLGLDQTCSHSHWPVNVRIRDGIPTEDQKSRPYASVKWHSDIWAGESSRNVMLHVPVFGNFFTNGIDFAEPDKRFYNEFVRDLKDYTEGSDLLTGIKKYDVSMSVGNAYLVDSYLLHKTNFSGREKDLRGIMSFPLWPKEDATGDDLYHNEKRDINFMPMNEWLGMGRNFFVATQNKLEKFKGEDVTKTSYASDFEIIETTNTSARRDAS